MGILERAAPSTKDRVHGECGSKSQRTSAPDESTTAAGLGQRECPPQPPTWLWLIRAPFVSVSRMRRIAIALATFSGAASAQGRPFSFTVPFANSTTEMVFRYDAGLSNGTFEPLGGDHILQTAELDSPIGSRVCSSWDRKAA